MWATRFFASAAHNPERLNRNAPLAIVAEPPNFCRSFMTSTWLGTSAKGFAPLVVPLTVPPAPVAPMVSPKPERAIGIAAAAEASRVFGVVADKSRMAMFCRFLRGTGSRG